MQYDHGDKTRGLSYEYYNFFLPLRKVVEAVSLFDFMQIMHDRGRDEMNRLFLETVKLKEPELVLVVPYTDQFIPDVIDEINRYSTTVGYFFDDVWRVQYSCFWAGHFSYVTTSDIDGVRRFRKAGYDNAIYSPFACNIEVNRKRESSKIYDVSFVGGYHPHREWYINHLRKSGIEVNVWGNGWKDGRIDQDRMVDVFNQSRINLNLSNSISWEPRFMLWSFRRIGSLRALIYSFRSFINNDMKSREQVKARHFEINACGAFQLSYYVKGLEHCFQPEKEIKLYNSPRDLVNKIRYYLKHEDEREFIARCGLKRTLEDHSMQKRFLQIFKTVAVRNGG